MMVTVEQLSEIFPSTPENIFAEMVEPLNAMFEVEEINNKNRIAMFLAQCGHESMGFKVRLENLNYSAQGLMRVFPKYFRGVNVNNYARKPVAIANRVYANRMGNGDEASGDGWKFRGKGFIQLTGHNNHKLFAEYMDMTIDEACEYLLTIEGAIDSAGWFWSYRDLNAPSDRGDIVTVTKRINGGLNGLEDRKHYYKAALEVL